MLELAKSRFGIEKCGVLIDGNKGSTYWGANICVFDMSSINPNDEVRILTKQAGTYDYCYVYPECSIVNNTQYLLNYNASAGTASWTSSRTQETTIITVDGLRYRGKRDNGAKPADYDDMVVFYTEVPCKLFVDGVPIGGETSSFYIGDPNGIARNVPKLYYGDANGIARQCKLYYGDPNGVARQIIGGGEKTANIFTSGAFNSYAMPSGFSLSNRKANITSFSDDIEGLSDWFLSEYVLVTGQQNVGQFFEIENDYIVKPREENFQYNNQYTFIPIKRIRNPKKLKMSTSLRSYDSRVSSSNRVLFRAGYVNSNNVFVWSNNNYTKYFNSTDQNWSSNEIDISEMPYVDYVIVNGMLGLPAYKDIQIVYEF